MGPNPKMLSGCIVGLASRYSLRTPERGMSARRRVSVPSLPIPHRAAWHRRCRSGHGRPRPCTSAVATWPIPFPAGSTMIRCRQTVEPTFFPESAASGYVSSPLGDAQYCSPIHGRSVSPRPKRQLRSESATSLLTRQAVPPCVFTRRTFTRRRRAQSMGRGTSRTNTR